MGISGLLVFRCDISLYAQKIDVTYVFRATEYLLLVDSW